MIARSSIQPARRGKATRSAASPVPEPQSRTLAGLDEPIHCIAVLRALQLGDLLCCVPALRALRAAYPRAHISLIGLPGARELAQRFERYIDELLVFPGIAAFPEQSAREAELPAFYAEARARHFDLALQLHGSGAQSNAVVRRLGARYWAGFVPDAGQAVAGWRLPWPDDLPEPRRYTALIRHLGFPVQDETLELPVSADEIAAARRLLLEHELAPARTIVLHGGARLASRRWPAECFAQVADALTRNGWQIALTGAAPDAPIVRDIAARCRLAPVDLCGRTSLGVLAALLGQVRLLIANDTGISHVAAAVGAPSVIVACGSDAARWAPLNRTLHHVLAAPVSCRPCAHRVCPTGHECATAITPAHLMASVHPLLGEVRHG
ncbi:MAG: glycosyltransferase family 9 protein [Pigmentiphaga sp.]